MWERFAEKVGLEPGVKEKEGLIEERGKGESSPRYTVKR